MKPIKRALAVLLVLAALAAFAPTAAALQLTEKQNAVLQTALAFHYKPSMQYDSTDLTDQPRSQGGILREHEIVTPEDATSDHTVYTVCSSVCWEVYRNVFGYQITEDHSKFLTVDIYNDPPEGLVVYRHDNNADKEGVDAAAEEVMKLMEPGDIIVSTVNGGGHAMLYVGDIDGDGEPDMIHSTGKKYDLASGTDQVEQGGNIALDPVSKRMGGTSGIAFRNPSVRYIILRPLLNTAATANITAAARSRMKYPEMAIDRTVSTGWYGSAAQGDTLTYSVAITNHSKAAYSGLPVKETVPAGTELIAGSITGGGTASGSNITWTLNVPAGETVTLTYQVKITAKRGETIVSGGGFVADIPSNTLRTTVSGKAPDAAKLQALKIGDLTAANTAFAVEAYEKALGVNIALPTAKDIVKNMFTYTQYPGTKLYTLNDTFTGAYQTVKSMMIPGWTGGKMLHTETSWDRNLECLLRDLQPGDIVISTSPSATDATVNTYVWTGEKLLSSIGGKSAEAREKQLVALQTKDIFFALRPSLAFDDMTVEAKASVKLPFTDVTEADWFYTYVKDLYNDGTVNGMTPTTFVPKGNLTYGQALKLIVCALGHGEQASTGGHWASGYLKFAQDKGWITGNVDLNGNVTRLAFCQIAAKAKNLTEQPASNPFKDTNDTAVLALNKAGVINGMSADTFSPNGLLTRAQISKIIHTLRGV
ncbi:MAG: S-layer homology domain-containing protein [Oscillospiraceae bacterium]|nr:S-layer homology domain-containing protein [Oscillospiraceae bacterium]